MLRLGVTGSMATGKSTVLGLLAEHGAHIYSADAAVHELYEGAAAAEVEALFPGVAPQGPVDRARLAAALAAAPHRLADLEALIHPKVRARIAAFLEDAEAGGAAIAAVEVPLLFETGHDYGFDEVLVTVCDEDVQRARALARPGMSVEKLDSLLARQMPQAEKRRRADHVLDTSGPLELTRSRVGALVSAIQARRAQQ